MSAPSKAGLTLAVVVLAALAWWQFGGGGAPEPGVGGTGGVEVDDAGAEEEARGARGRAGAAAEDEKDPVAAAPAEGEPEAAPSGPFLRIVAGPEPGAAALGGATVVLARQDGYLETLVADDAGIARVPDGGTGTCVAWASAVGRGRVRFESLEIGEGETRIVIPEGQTLRVRFVGANGVTIGHEAVRSRFGRPEWAANAMLVWDGALGGGDQMRMLRTMLGAPGTWRRDVPLTWDPAGALLEDKVGAGRWRVFLTTPDGLPYLTASVVAEGGGNLTVDVTVPASPDVRRVRFVDGESGAPLAGASVRGYFEHGDDQAFLPSRPLVTDDGGEVAIPIMDRSEGAGWSDRQRPPTWWLETPDHVRKMTQYELDRGVPNVVQEVQVLRTATAFGAAYRQNGEPAVGEEVVFLEKGLRRAATVGPDGRYELAGLPVHRAPRSRVRVFLIENLDSLSLRTATAQAAPGERVEIPVGEPADPGANATLVGTITAGGVPLEKVFVALRPKDRFVMTNAEGVFVLDNLKPGSIRVRVLLGDPAASDDYGLRSGEGIELSAGDERRLDFDLPGGVMRVVVLDDATGKPVGGAAVIARPENRDASANRFPAFHYSAGWAAMTDSKGVARMRALLPNEGHQIAVRADGYEKRWVKDRQAGTNEAPAEVEIRIKRKRKWK